jgi:hypothetical protein
MHIAWYNPTWYCNVDDHIPTPTLSIALHQPAKWRVGAIFFLPGSGLLSLQVLVRNRTGLVRISCVLTLIGVLSPSQLLQWSRAHEANTRINNKGKRERKARSNKNMPSHTHQIEAMASRQAPRAQQSTQSRTGMSAPGTT